MVSALDGAMFHTLHVVYVHGGVPGPCQMSLVRETKQLKSLSIS